MNPLPTHIPLYYWANPPTLNTRQYIAQGLVYPMKTVHTVQSFLDTFCQNGLQFRIICACKAVKGAYRNHHSVITASRLNSPPPPPTRTLVMSSLLYPPLGPILTLPLFFYGSTRLRPSGRPRCPGLFVLGNANPAAPEARPATGTLGNCRGTGDMVPFVNRTLDWGVGIAILLSVLSVVPRPCARLTDFLIQNQGKSLRCQ